MRRRLLASLIVCVALLTQIAASHWGATAMRDGYPGCHRQTVSIDDAQLLSGGEKSSSRLPVDQSTPHDHASCSLCQLGFSFIGVAAPAEHVRALALEWRIELPTTESAPHASAFNRNAPARAPPSRS
jgi:hypothetical protein